MKTRVKLFGIIAAIAWSFAASTPIQAQEAKSDSAAASSDDSARLVVNRAANLGILESVNVFVVGVQVAELELSQSYNAVLRLGQHVLSITMNPKTSGQRGRLNDASTQSSARLTHSRRFGEALITLRLRSKRGCRRRSRLSLMT